MVYHIVILLLNKLILEQSYLNFNIRKVVIKLVLSLKVYLLAFIIYEVCYLLNEKNNEKSYLECNLLFFILIIVKFLIA